MAKPHPIARLLLPSRAGHAESSPSFLRAFACGPRDSSPGRLHSWTLTLERGIGKAYGGEVELQATGAFRAEVFPDLPIATTWQNLAKALTSGLTASATADPAPPFTHFTTRPGALKVITAAANLRSEYDIERRVVAAAGDGAAAVGGQRANALLCVSGSHPVRTLPLVSRFLRSSLDTLRVAQRLRQGGYIPPQTQLWVVANPNTERGAALLEAKASWGATAVLTQPPLDWPAYLAWLADAERRGLLRPAPPRPQGPAAAAEPAQPGVGGDPSGSAASRRSSSSSNSNSSAGDQEAGSDGDTASGGGLRLLVGHPVLSSAASLSFWISLSGCAGSAAAQSLLAEATRVELAGKEAAMQHFASYNRQLVSKVLQRGGVAGLHVMPIPKVSKRMVLDMLVDGSLPPSAP